MNSDQNADVNDPEIDQPSPPAEVPPTVNAGDPKGDQPSPPTEVPPTVNAGDPKGDQPSPPTEVPPTLNAGDPKGDQPAEGVPSVVNVSKAKIDDPPPSPVTPPTFLQGAGVELAKWVLIIIIGFLVVTILFLAITEITSASLLTNNYNRLIAKDADPTAVAAFVEQIKLQRKEFRDFWLQFEQMILLNLLLPVLTAILGYVFGTREKGG